MGFRDPVGALRGSTITAATVQTAETGTRIVLHSKEADGTEGSFDSGIISLHSGHVDEIWPGEITVNYGLPEGVGSAYGALQIYPPNMAGDIGVGSGIAMHSNGDMWINGRPEFTEGFSSFSMRPLMAEEATNQTITSTSWAAGDPVCAVTFTAPPAGRVLVAVSGAIEGMAPEYGISLSYEIRANNAAGAVVKAANGNYGIAAQGIYNLTAGNLAVVEGLTPGATYYVQTMHKANSVGTTVTAFHRRLVVQPSP